MKAHEVSRAVYEAAIMPQQSVDAATLEILQRFAAAKDAFMAPPCQIYPTLGDLGISGSEFRRLVKSKMAENRGFGPRVTIAGSCELDIAKGVNPWLGGPYKTHERLAEEALDRGDYVPDDVLAEYPRLRRVQFAPSRPATTQGTPAVSYQAVFENQFEAERAALKAARDAAQAEWDKQTADEQRRRQPKKKGKRDPLPDAVYEGMRAAIRAAFHIDDLEAELERLWKERTAALYAAAPSVVFAPDVEFREVGTCSVSTYSTQTQPGLYAEASLRPLQYKLDQLGIPTRLECEPYTGAHGGADWKLYAACPLWMADAAERLVTLHDISVACGRVVNLKVLLPFLSYEDLDRHFAGTL
jgi:hypothetical protein